MGPSRVECRGTSLAGHPQPTCPRSLCSASSGLRTSKFQGATEQRVGRQAPGLLCSVTSAHCGEGLQTHQISTSSTSLMGQNKCPGPRSTVGTPGYTQLWFPLVWLGTGLQKPIDRNHPDIRSMETSSAGAELIEPKGDGGIFSSTAPVCR